MRQHGLEGSLPRRLVIEAAVVPSIVSHAEDRRFGHLALLHGVAHNANTAYQLRGQFGLRIHLGHVVEVGVHVHGEYLRVGIVVTGIVPPPGYVATKLSLGCGQVVAVGHRPHTVTRGVDGNVLGRGGQCLEEAVVLVGAAGKGGAVDLRYEVQRLHRVGGNGPRLVIFLFKRPLQCRQVVGILLQVGVRTGHAHVVHEDGKLTYAEFVHLVELAHDVVDNGAAADEVVARVNGPDKVDLRGRRGGSDVAHHVLREPPVAFLLLCDGGGIGILPVL